MQNTPTIPRCSALVRTDQLQDEELLFVRHPKGLAERQQVTLCCTSHLARLRAGSAGAPRGHHLAHPACRARHVAPATAFPASDRATPARRAQPRHTCTRTHPRVVPGHPKQPRVARAESRVGAAGRAAFAPRAAVHAPRTGARIASAAYHLCARCAARAPLSRTSRTIISAAMAPPPSWRRSRRSPL